jgi:NDP-4-keto-2,6-dideoxyhexose 3-C-methyltransferase
MSHKIIKCRNCNNNKFKELFSLGKLAFTGKFPNKYETQIPKEYINLIICTQCKLVQLDRNFDSRYLYGKDYGYRSGINKTMSEHLKKIASKLKIFTKLKSGDAVLDIASNDGTLLNNYPKNIFTVGVDPIIKKLSKFYNKEHLKIGHFFSAKKILEFKIKKKFKIITALSVFYDLKNPNSFLSDVNKIIDIKNGIFLLEHADLHSIIRNNLFDTICHEHLTYYSSKIIIEMAKKNNFKIIDIERNDINGGSTRFYLAHKDSIYKEKKEKISEILLFEKKLKLESSDTFKKFYKKILKLKTSLNILINKITINKKIIHGYGASTKGNVLLQFYNIGNKNIKYIADRNIQKNNHYTPGTRIKIISEKISRSLCPDYYLVLPWHFKKEILKREKKLLKKNTNFIFPLPRIKVLKCG